MKTRIRLIAALVSLGVSGSVLRAVLVEPGHGLLISQVDFTFNGAVQPNSAFGMAAVDIAAVTAATGVSSGFLNIATDAGWVVQNMPIVASTGYPGLSKMFNLGISHGVDITSLALRADLSPDPVVSFTGVLASEFVVDMVGYNAGGRGAPATGAPDPQPTPDLPRSAHGLIQQAWETYRDSVEQDENQCGPGALANSLQWLESTGLIDVPHEHQPGIDGQPPDSLVGAIDQAMQRVPHQPVNDDQFMRGKLSYINESGLDDDLVVKHWGGIFAPGDYQHPSNPSLVSEDQTGTMSLVEWIRQEIENGEDVELALGGPPGSPGHWVNVTGIGSTLGVDWISWVHDANQGYVTTPEGEEETANNGGTAWNDGGWGISDIKDGKLVDYFGYTLDFAVSESKRVPDSFPVWIAFVVVGCLARLASRRSRRS